MDKFNFSWLAVSSLFHFIICRLNSGFSNHFFTLIIQTQFLSFNLKRQGVLLWIDAHLLFVKLPLLLQLDKLLTDTHDSNARHLCHLPAFVSILFYPHNCHHFYFISSRLSHRLIIHRSCGVCNWARLNLEF